jgi:hypothetical protein
LTGASAGGHPEATGAAAATDRGGGSVREGRSGLGKHTPAATRISAVVFALLVLGCFAALLVTQRLKHTPTLVQAFKLTHVIVPTSGGESKEEHISFKLAKADEVTVTIESSSGETVATLVRDLPVRRYKVVSLRWNGRSGAASGYRTLRRTDGYTTLIPINTGALASPGDYTVRVRLRAQDRSVPSSRTFKLVGG